MGHQQTFYSIYCMWRVVPIAFVVSVSLLKLFCLLIITIKIYIAWTKKRNIIIKDVKLICEQFICFLNLPEPEYIK